MRDQSENETGKPAEDIGSQGYARDWIAQILQDVHAKQRQEGASQRQCASELDMPRTTLQYWEKQQKQLTASPLAVAFFESPEGLAFLHRLVVAALLVMTWAGPCGIRLVCQFIELTGLGVFVANSYSSQQRASKEMQGALVEYGQEERARLALDMKRKEITVCEDETFLSEDICLIAMEPVSGFILLEGYAEKGDTKTWDAALGKAMKGLNLKVIQSTSDEAAALARHARGLGAEHSPDLFHVQHEIAKAMALPLSGREKRIEEAHGLAKKEVARQVEAERAYREGPRKPGRPPAFDKHIDQARAAEAVEAARLEQVKEQRLRWRGAVHGIERAYHPFDLLTGSPRTPEVVSTELGQKFAELDKVAEEAGLSQASVELLEKARRVLPKMVSTMRFFHQETRRMIESLALPPEQEALLYKNLIPSAYPQRVASKTTNKDTKAIIRRTLDELLSELLFPGGPAASLSEEVMAMLEKAAFACADVFQRSSSCLEGRNGRISQFEHAMRRLHPKKLAGLTVIHAFFIRRSDNTTAAERFFGAPSRDLFEWLLDHLSLPARPFRPQASLGK